MIRLVLYWQLMRCIIIFDLWRLKIDASRLVQGLVVDRCLRLLDVSKERSAVGTTLPPVMRFNNVGQEWNGRHRFISHADSTIKGSKRDCFSLQVPTCRFVLPVYPKCCM
jgi:hypothetical protein